MMNSVFPLWRAYQFSGSRITPVHAARRRHRSLQGWCVMRPDILARSRFDDLTMRSQALEVVVLRTGYKCIDRPRSPLLLSLAARGRNGANSETAKPPQSNQ